MKDIVLYINDQIQQSDVLTEYCKNNIDIFIEDSNQTIDDIVFVMSNGDNIKLNIDCEFFDSSNEINFAESLWDFYKNYNIEFFKKIIFYYFEDLNKYFKPDDILNFDCVKIIALLNDNK